MEKLPWGKKRRGHPQVVFEYHKVIVRHAQQVRSAIADVNIGGTLSPRISRRKC